MRPNCTPKFTPLAIQVFSMMASLFCIIFSVFSFIDFNIARLVINIYVLAFGVLAFIADIKCFNFFGYIKFLYTPVGRGLLFLLIGCIMISKNLFQMISGIAMVAVGITYFIAARMWGGVPRPMLQRNVEDLPLNTELRFVDSESMTGGTTTNQPSSVRSTPQGFRL